MLTMLINRTRTGLTEEDYRVMGEQMQAFYAGIPPGVRIHGEYSALDWSRNFTVIETESEAQLRELMAPFAPYVEMEAIPVKPTEWFAAQQAAAR